MATAEAGSSMLAHARAWGGEEEADPGGGAAEPATGSVAAGSGQGLGLGWGRRRGAWGRWAGEVGGGREGGGGRGGGVGSGRVGLGSSSRLS
jgi:hypothetical protein